MSGVNQQVKQLAQTTGQVLGAILALFFQFKVIIRLLGDLQSWYRDLTAYPQSKQSIILTYAIGAFLLSATYAATLLIPVFAGLLTGGILVGSVASPVFFAALLVGLFLAMLFVIPLIFAPMLAGYFIREMGIILHTDNDKTVIEAPFREDRPAFRDVFSLSLDGYKAGTLPFLYIITVFFVWYNTTGVIDIFTGDLQQAIANPVGLLLTAVVAILGVVVLPVFLARYADTGRLSATVSNPIQFIRDVVLTSSYSGYFLGGGFLIIVGIVVPVAVFSLSPFLMPTLGLPIAFLVTLQAVDLFALGYKRTVSSDAAESHTEVLSIDDDQYILPFREGGVATPDRDRSILALGETGSGKTEAIKLLTYQFQTDDTDPFVVFDYKDDYKQFFGSSTRTDGGDTPSDIYPDDLVVLSLENSTHYWNIFQEAESEADFEEIGRSLFAADEKNSQNPYFPKAARQVFVAVLKLMDRSDAWEYPTNEDLMAYFEQKDLESIHKELKNHPDLRGVAANINIEAEQQSLGVYGHLQTVIREIFKGDFRENPHEGEGFSIREYMADPNGRTLILDFPTDSGDSIKPAFRLFIDWAIRFGLDDNTRDSYFLLDEFATIPGLERIERLVNAGRARNAYGILGVQAKTQLFATYGENEGEAILSGLAQEILLRPGDAPSVEHIRDRVGRHQRKHLEQGPTDQITRVLTDRESEYNQFTIQEEHPISETELQQFDPGEAVILEQTSWRRGHLFRLDDPGVRTLLDTILDGQPQPDDTNRQKQDATLPAQPARASGGSESDQ